MLETYLTMKSIGPPQNLSLQHECISSQKSMESISGGARSASVEELRAPTSEMKMSRRGIAAAIPTETELALKES